MAASKMLFWVKMYRAPPISYWWKLQKCFGFFGCILSIVNCSIHLNFRWWHVPLRIVCADPALLWKMTKWLHLRLPVTATLMRWWSTSSQSSIRSRQRQKADELRLSFPCMSILYEIYIAQTFFPLALEPNDVSQFLQRGNLLLKTRARCALWQVATYLVDFSEATQQQ